jgi:hypothetical protein
MRGVRIAAFAVAAFLGCLVITHMLSVDPAPPADDSVDLANQPGSPPNVPPPPPLSGSPVAHPAKKVPAPSRIASQSQAPPPVIDAPTDAKPDVIGADPVEVAAAPLPAQVETASLEEPKGPVIVTPHERPKQENRGVRWLRAVGHALGIGTSQEPPTQTFR